MIRNLRIENFILAEKLDLNLGNGLQALTGETGAGKSILVGAIDLIFGGALKTMVLRDESKPAILEISLDVDERNSQLMGFVKKYELELTEKEIFVSREIGQNQRSKSYLNGRRVSQQIIRELRAIILDFHSQRDQQKLFDNEYQLEIVDKFGKLIDQRDEFTVDFEALQLKISQLKKLKKTERDAEERIQLYTYQLQELEDLNIQPGEDETLQNEMNLLSNAEKILKESANFEQEIFEQERSVYDILSHYISALEEYSEDNENIAEGVSNIREALASIDSALISLRELPALIDLDGARLEELESRLDEINSIKAKYRKTLLEIFSYQKKITEDLENFTSGKEQILILQNEIENSKQTLIKRADKLSSLRKKAALKFESEIGKNMKELAVPEAVVSFVFDNSTHYSKKEVASEVEELELSKEYSKTDDLWKQLSPTGKDEVEIYFSANKGLKQQPLKFAASGGELSRFLLTVKKILSDSLDRKIIIFDEIDTGIGGRTALLLGEFIQKISSYHQVICITHLAQIASFAQQHFSILKRSSKNSTILEVAKLDAEAKRNEIARMLSGSDSEIALKYADELLNN